jgi:curved DNA-binding protein CbpA
MRSSTRRLSAFLFLLADLGFRGTAFVLQVHVLEPFHRSTRPFLQLAAAVDAVDDIQGFRAKKQWNEAINNIDSLSSPDQQQHQHRHATAPHSNANANTTLNLYEVLGAHGNETKSELKHLYTQLAKQCHPDATASTSNNSLEFTHAAAAWGVLRHSKERRRYDRTLQAERLRDAIVAWADQAVNAAAPYLERAFWTRPTEEVQDVSEEICAESTTTNIIPNETINEYNTTVTAATVAAAPAITNESAMIRLENVTTTLEDPLNPRMTSSNATRIWNNVAPKSRVLSFWEKIRLKSPMEHEIRELAFFENMYETCCDQESIAQQALEARLHEQLQTNEQLQQAQLDEIEARKLLAFIQKRVQESKRAVAQARNQVQQADAQTRLAQSNADQAAFFLHQQSAKVQKALQRKQMRLFQNNKTASELSEQENEKSK